MIEFIEVNDVENEAFREAMDIYLEAIPEAERQKISVIKERVMTGKEQLLVGRLNGEAVCMALIYPLQNSGYVLIDYLAIKKACRQKGIGTNLIRHIQNVYDAKSKCLLGEVEDPKQGDNKQARARRLAFYKRNGARQLKDVAYLMPPMHGTQPTSMILIIFMQTNDPEIDGELVKKIIRQIYAELYERNSKDSLLNSFINLIPPTVKLE